MLDGLSVVFCWLLILAGRTCYLRLRFISEYGRLLAQVTKPVKRSLQSAPGSLQAGLRQSKQWILSEFPLIYENNLFVAHGHLLPMIQRLLVTSEIIRHPAERKAGVASCNEC